MLDSLLARLEEATMRLIVPIYLALIVIELLLSSDGLLFERGIRLAHVLGTACNLLLVERAFRPTLIA